MLRCILPFKKPANGVLSVEQENFNRSLSSDRIIVENFFGRMMNLWNVMSGKFTLSEKLYDTFVAMCVGLTNVHIDMHPLRNDDNEWFNRYRNRLLKLGEERKRKRAETQALYRARRTQRLRFGYRDVAGELDETQEP